MNYLSEVNYGMFCSQRFMLKLWLATEQGGLLLNTKWTVCVDVTTLVVHKIIKPDPAVEV